MRRPTTIIKGLLALAVLAGLVIGLPAALLAVGGSPLPDTVPDPSQWWAVLTSRDDGTLLLGVLRVAAWIGWAMFTLSVAADVLARARRVQVPRLGPQQALASQLVAAVAALAVLTPAAANAAAVPASAIPPSGASTSTAAPATLDTAWTPQAAGPASTGERASGASRSQTRGHTKHQVVRGDTLWDIAAEEFGDPYAWPKIYAASTRVVQPGGQHLNDPDLIRPGWTLRIPATSATSTGDAPDPAPATQAPTPESSAGAPTSSDPDLVTPLGGGGAGRSSVAPPAAVPPIMTPLSLPAARVSTPLNTHPPASAGGAEVAARDWRARIRAAVPDLQ